MPRVIRNNLENFLVILVIFSLMTGWLFSGWPQIWQNPPIPPEVQEAQATTETFTTAGTFTNGWTAPADVVSVTAETWGGGGGSGGGTNTGLPGGSGGGGGAYASKVISVTPGNSYTYVVGAAGLKDGGTAGGNSSFTGDASVQSLACGGTSGAANGGTAGAGGTTACSDGTSEFAGGAGAAGAGTSGGGGGESAGTTATGGSASGTTGGTGTDGTDGSAGQLVGVNGVAGNNPGAGAGGSGQRSGGVEQGASGGVGQVRLTYTAITYCITRTDSEGTIEYGSEDMAQSTSTEPTTGSNQIAIFQNCGNQAKFNIKTGNSTNWTAITGDPSAQTNQFRHSFATTSPVINWQVMGIDPSYAVASSTVDNLSSLNVYLKIELPGTDNSNYSQQSVTVTVQAAAP